MEPHSWVGLLILVCLEGLLDPCTCLLDNEGGADIEAVRYILQDEKEKRLLLENDVEIMMLKLAELERRCKKDITPAESASSIQCPYAFSPGANSCYLYVPVQSTWIEAQMYCRVFGGSLVSIETPEELTVLRDYLQSSKIPMHIALFNAQSVGPLGKHKEIVNCINNQNIDVFYLTETWLKASGDEPMCVDLIATGYKSFPRHSRGSGIAVITKNWMKK